MGQRQCQRSQPAGAWQIQCVIGTVFDRVPRLRSSTLFSSAGLTPEVLAEKDYIR